MARTLLLRGMLVGLAAGLLAFAFAALFGEPQVNHAIAFEAAHAAPGMDEPALVSRAVQSTAGLGVAAVVYGAALGGIFALAYAFAYGRVGGLGARATSLLVAGIGFVAIEVVPFLKYPANPPSIGNPDTIGQRTTLYFLMIAIAVAAATVALITGRALTARLGSWNAWILAAGVFVAITAVAGLLLPAVMEVPTDFPATVLWQFRLASFGIQLVVWATLGLLFGALTERSHRRHASALQHATAG